MVPPVTNAIFVDMYYFLGYKVPRTVLHAHGDSLRIYGEHSRFLAEAGFPELTWRYTGKVFEEFGKIGWVVSQVPGNLGDRRI